MLKNLTRRWNRSSLSLDKMWFLRDASAIDGASLEPAVKDVLEQIRSNGVGIIKGNIPAELPLNHYFGVWNALEDVLPGSGPLIYYERGHMALADTELLGNPSVNAQNYFGKVVRACEARGLKVVEYYAKKGDTLIWHPEMPHGGAAILNARQSRRSIVFHYIPEGVPIHGADVFFGTHGRVHKTQNYRTVDFGVREVIDQGHPRFFHNRFEGNFDEA